MKNIEKSNSIISLMNGIQKGNYHVRAALMYDFFGFLESFHLALKRQKCRTNTNFNKALLYKSY